jgi:dTDP-4-dehydrorhamnose 3,5-epimerase
MIVKQFEIKDLLLLQLQQFNDDRGIFFETYNEKKYNSFFGEEIQFVQDNLSISKKDVLRGLHFQSPPFAQGKLVSVLKGAVLDVAVDLRKTSETYGKHVMVELNSENGYQFWIPPGFAHGFLSLENDTIFSYKCTNYYSPNHENTLLWNDVDLNVIWPKKNPIISKKDADGLKFITFESPF